MLYIWTGIGSRLVASSPKVSLLRRPLCLNVWIRQVLRQSSFSVLTHSTSSQNPFTANNLCFCYRFCILVICTVIRFVPHRCNSSTLHSFVSFSVLLLTIQYLVQWRLLCSSELKYTQAGFYSDFNPPLFRPKSSFSFSFSFFHGRCLRSSVFLLSSFSLKGFLSTYLRKFSISSSSPHSSQSIILLNE